MPETAFLLQEDEAIKTYLGGITVSDTQNANRPVQVWYRDPEMEFRDRTFPFVMIDLIDISESTERGRHNNGRLKLSDLTYKPPGAVLTQVANHTYLADRPMPVNLDYQITGFSRSARHDRQLWTALLRKFPGRWGALYVPGDNTARSMFLTGTNGDSTIDNEGKRIFRRVFTVRVLSELWATQIKSIQNLETLTFSFTFPADVALIVSELACYSE